jgi:hypothetical protein
MAPRSSAAGVASKASTKSRTSDRLEEDAQAMEARLVQLRLKMLEDKQKLEKDLPVKFGGARWRSAQETIGSVSRYAKDVEDRMVKKPSGKSTAKADTGDVKLTKKTKKKTLENGRAKVVPSIAIVQKWTTHHVLEWLTSLALDEFHSAFEYHQVTGSVLLEIQPDEFARIGVTRLSARNLLWQELERIKEALATAAGRCGSGSIQAAEVIDPKIVDIPLVPEVSSPGKRGIHWSHVRPLRDPDTTAPQAEVPVNLADGEFDEDGGHSSFMKALLDWRAGDDYASTSGQGQHDDGMWVNPLMASNNYHDPPSSAGGALLEGEYDEVKEQDAFRRAVLAWRRAGTPETETAPRPSTAEIEVERTEQSCATDQRKSCWQCYRVARADSLVHDATSNRAFCGKDCVAAFEQEHARLYAKKEG